jgi:hypothetical protein
MKNPMPLLAPLFATACAVALQAQTPSSTKPPASAGRLNDYLREQYSGFERWDLGGEVRVRFESKSGFAVPGRGAGAVDFSRTTPDNTYWLLREKLHLGWQPCDWFAVFAEGRDSSSLSDARRPEPEEDSIDLHQGWVRLGNPAAFPLSLKVGRQELVYGDERLIGAFDWNNIGRVFDAAKLRFENQTLWVDAFTGRVVLADDNNFNVANDYDWFSGLYASTRSLAPKLETQLYLLARNTSVQSPAATTGSPQAGGPSARDIYTAGVRLKSLPGQFGPWDFEAEAAGQLGDFGVAGTGRLDHRAFAAHAGGGYTWQKAWASPRLGLEYDFASGDSDPTDGDHTTFENLFPTNHKFYGYMDFVSWQNVHHGRLALSAKPHARLTLAVDYHLFWLAETADFFYQVNGAPRTVGGYGLRPANDSFVGSEVDVVATYAVPKFGALQAGYGHFFRGDYLKQTLAATGSQDADWVYVQAVFRF